MDDDELLRGMVAASPDAQWLVGFDGRTIHANQRFADLVGYRLDELDDVPATTFADEQGRADFAGHLQAMREGHPGDDNEEVLLVRRDGSRAWTLVSWRPVHDRAGTPIGYLHRLTEYTERRRLLEELQRREEALASASRIARLGGWSWEVLADRVTWTPELFAIFDVDPATFGGTWDAAFRHFHPDDRAGAQAVILNAMRHHDEFSWEARFVTSGGSVRWIRSYGQFERDVAGVVVRASGACQDITDLRDADWAAGEATRRLALLQQMAEAANRSSTVADALARSAQVLAQHSGWRPVCVFVRDAPDGPLTAQLPDPPDPPGPLDPPPDPRGAVLPAPDPELAERAWRGREVEIASAAPQWPGSSVVMLPVLAGRGVSCVVQLLADVEEPDVVTWTLLRQVSDQLSRVAERERAAVQLAEARDVAMEASRHKSEFLATISHEIRTPMNGVIGLNDLLLDTELDRRQRRLAEGLRSAGLTLLALINDILDLSKIESGTLDLEVTEFDVRALVEQTAVILAGPAEDKRLDLVVGCGPEVPPTLLGDPVRLGQVLTNLGSNAVKFTETGAVVVDVTVTPAPSPADADGAGVLLRVEVRDTGIGIAEADLESVFDSFTQADRSTTRQHGGTGLGLAISRQLVERMGGEIGVRSVPGAGSVFWFTAALQAVPADGGVALGVEPPLRVPPRPHARPDLGLRVLVVEDNAVNQLVAAGLLESLGCSAVVVGNGAEAVAALRPGHGFDVVLMDCRMPRLDGFDATRAIRARESGAHGAGARVPIIAMTASALPGERDRCLAAGMDDFLTKPVEPAQLTAAIARAAPGREAPPDRPPPSATPPDDVLDPERVELLGELVKDGVSFFERGRMSFLARIDGSLAQLRTAAAAGDADRIALDAHQLRGSALNLGLRRVGAAAEALEETARAEGLGHVGGLVDLTTHLEAAVAEGVEALAAVGREGR